MPGETDDPVRIFYWESPLKSHPIPTFIVLGLLALALACTVKDPATPVTVWPDLSDAAAPTLYLGTDTDYNCKVSVDPAADFAAIVWRLYTGDFSAQLSQGSMADHGIWPDLVRGDGRFIDWLWLDDVQNTAGSYRLVFAAQDADGNDLDTLSAPLTVFEGKQNTAPRMFTLEGLPDSTQAGDVLNLVATVFDAQGKADLDSVWADVFAPYSVAVHEHWQMNFQPGPDSLFTADWMVPSEAGPWTLRFKARDKGGLESRPWVRMVQVTVLDGPPVIEEVMAPDTVSRNAGQPILLAVRVSDPAGLADIQSVVFSTTKPDGTASSGNPFALFDDGTQGDVTAGDGVYSLAISISPANVLGDYQFEFVAQDRAGNVGTPVVHTLTVVD